MKDKLIKSMSKDLNIVRFLNETECEFNQRLIYSAGAAWAKTLVYGHSYVEIQEEKGYPNADIMYIESHLAKVLEMYLKCFEINLDWMDSDNPEQFARNLAGHLIAQVLYSYCLAKINSRRITKVPVRYVDFGDKYLIRGSVDFNRNVFTVGASQWIAGEYVAPIIEDFASIRVLGKDYYDVMIREFEWKGNELQSHYQIFMIGSKGQYSKCWKHIEIKDIPQGISLLKLEDEYNGGFFLVDKKKNEYKIADLDPWYVEKKEVYRIMYALNYFNDTKAEYKVKDMQEYYIIRCSSALPEYESRILMACSWPYAMYNNNHLRIVPQSLWSIVLEKISNLGVDIIYT
ncbi:MAG: hypothetical protein CVV02_03915 [Firmicutes bacterium HGW-Firmicutes-7]|nr:MAG: hypothetical protein CVV02_03915 [Firmicutes bacterium HGW-Firmicutes-7]